MTKKSRLTALDSLRGFGILLVVLGHTSQTNDLVSWIFSFHMPLFFIISGMLFHERQFLDSFKRKAVRLLVPYVFFGTVTLAYWALIERRLRGDEGDLFRMRRANIVSLAQVAIITRRMRRLFLPCLFVTEMLFLGIFTFVKSKRAIRYDWVVAATLATVSFLSIIAMHSFDLPIDRLRLPWALDILPFSMLFSLHCHLLSRFLMPCMRKSAEGIVACRLCVIGMAGLGLLRVFDELTGLSVNLNDASTSNPFWMLCAALLGFISSLMLCVLLSTAGCCSSLAGRRLPSCAYEPVKRVLIFVMAKILDEYRCIASESCICDAGDCCHCSYLRYCSSHYGQVCSRVNRQFPSQSGRALKARA